MKEIELKVGKADFADIGRDLVRINIKDRPENVNRHDIVVLNVNGKSALAVIRGNDEPGEINIDIDIRDDLALQLGKRYSFIIEKAGCFSRLWWYLRARDPAVRIPAWLAFWSVVLGFAGFILGVVSLCK